MKGGIDMVMIAIVLTNMALLGSSRIAMCIRTVAIQGFVLALLPVLVDAHDLSPRDGAFSIATILLKAVVFPWLLLRALRNTTVRREVDPFLGYTLSLIVGAAALGFALWLDRRLPLPVAFPSRLLVPVAFFTIFCGLFILLSRRQAISQVIGYLVLENGITSFGLALAMENPFIVEVGILLDLFVAVFVMGIAIFHISREFDHIDTRQMALHDESSDR